MASKFELSISSDYVSNWGIVEAVREIFQNALDEQMQNSYNKMYFSYENGELLIGNKNSRLSKKTLLLGVTSKSDDNNTIGQFGEGYKIATTVLLRLGKKVTIYNYGAREIWTTRLVKSRKYEGALVTTFFVDKLMFRKVPSYDLIITISDVSEDEYEEIKESNLHLQDLSDCEIKESPGYGRILMHERYKGKVYVSGLYVCSNDDLKYGYDFNPDKIKIGRDRDVISSFDLAWTVSQMATYIADCEDTLDNASVDSDEFRYMGSFMDVSMKEHYAKKFIEEHGENAYPVSNNNEYQQAIKSGKDPVMVKQWQREIIADTDVIEDINNEEESYQGLTEGNLYDILYDFLNNISSSISEAEYEFLESLITDYQDELSDIEKE